MNLPVLPDYIPPYVPPQSELSRPSANQINQAARQAREVALTLAGFNEPPPLVYGEDRVTGLWLVRPYTHIGSGNLRFALAWAWGESEGVQTIVANGATLPGGVTLTHYEGTWTQTPDPTLAADIPGFNDAYQGLAYTVFSVPPGVITGFPQTASFEAIFRGRLCYDERTGLRVWTRNPGLCINDFLTAADLHSADLGPGIPCYGTVAVADRCDSLVGGIEVRSEVGISFSALSIDDVMNLLCPYAECLWSYHEDGILLVPDAPVTPHQRASAATYRDQFGVLKTAQQNVARVGYDEEGNYLGLIVEEAATNLITQNRSMAGLFWEIQDLFDNGETGTLASDLPYFVDVDGETEATWGDPVGLVRDASPNHADFTQPTVTARPVLGREPVGGRRNLLQNSVTYSSVFNTGSASQWSKEGEDNIFEFTSGTQTNYGLFGVTPLEQYTFSQDIALGTATVAGYAVYDHTNSVWIVTPATYEGLSSEFQRRDFTFTVPEGCTQMRIYAVRYINNGSLGTALFRNPQFETGSVATPYQRVASWYDITEEGVQSAHYLDFDGTDDIVSTELPAIENGTLVIAGTGGIWIDDDYNFAGGTFSIGPTSYTGGPAGILTAIGEPIAGSFLVIDRQLTRRERELVIRELKEMGAPGVLVP